MTWWCINPLSRSFISVERGRGTDAIPAIAKVNHGDLEVLELDSIPHSQVAIPNEPDEKAMLEFEPQRTYAITDIKYYNGETRCKISPLRSVFHLGRGSCPTVPCRLLDIRL